MLELKTAASILQLGRQPTARIAAQIDSTVVNRRRSKQTLSTLILSIGEGTMQKSANNELIWALEQDEVDYLVDRLAQRETEGIFSPAEFVQVSVPKGSDLNMVYWVDLPSPAVTLGT